MNREANMARVAARTASRELVIEVYKATKHFDPLQQYKYGNEIRKVATSMSSYITEGSSRHELEDQTTYLLMGYESMVELLNKLIEVKQKNILDPRVYILLKLRIDDLAQKINFVAKPPENK